MNTSIFDVDLVLSIIFTFMSHNEQKSFRLINKKFKSVLDSKVMKDRRIKLRRLDELATIYQINLEDFDDEDAIESMLGSKWTTKAIFCHFKTQYPNLKNGDVVKCMLNGDKLSKFVVSDEDLYHYSKLLSGLVEKNLPLYIHDRNVTKQKMVYSPLYKIFFIELFKCLAIDPKNNVFNIYNILKLQIGKNYFNVFIDDDYVNDFVKFKSGKNIHNLFYDKYNIYRLKGDFNTLRMELKEQKENEYSHITDLDDSSDNYSDDERIKIYDKYSSIIDVF